MSLNIQTYTTENDPLGTFIVVSNGELDETYIEAAESALRKQMLHDIARNAITAVGRSTYATVKGIGSAFLELMDAAAAAGREA